MIDTVRLKHKFTDTLSYNDCYKIIDDLARESLSKHCLHKDKTKKNSYFTTAFAPMGLLEIRFFKQKKFKGNFIQLILKPARLIKRNSHLKLSNRDKHYEMIEEIFDNIMNFINNRAQDSLLPSFADWTVSRIDYAYDLETPYVREYINLFKRGALPKNFKKKREYETSVYLVSKKCRVNFYDKIFELKDKYDLTDEDIKTELGYLPEGILRLEIQCENKKIQKLKEKYSLPESSLEYLWDEMIAHDVISHYVKAIIGEEDCYSLNKSFQELREKYDRGCTFELCSRIITILVNHAVSNLADIKNMFSDKKGFNNVIFKIRQANINPITTEAISMGNANKINYLKNPYKIISEQN